MVSTRVPVRIPRDGHLARSHRVHGTVNGRDWVKESAGEGAAGSTYAWTAYSTPAGSNCVSLTFVLHSRTPDAYPSPMPTFNEPTETSVFLQIVNTFTLLSNGTNSGTISGNVHDASDSSISNATVCAFNFDTHEMVSCPLTGSDGNYAITGLPPADYRVEVSAKGWAFEMYKDLPYGYLNSATRVPVKAGATTSGIDFTLKPGGFIRGAVYQSDGNTPIAKISVVADFPDESFRGTCSDTSGHYIIDNLPYGIDLRVRAYSAGNWCSEPEDYAQEYWQETPLQVDATVLVLSSGTPEYGNINFSLTSGTALPQTVLTLTPRSCLTGTWRVDTASYVSWMKKVNQAPTVLFTNIDPPFYYKFNDDGSFAIYAENIGLYFDAIDPNSGKSAGTFKTISTGIVKGTVVKLDPDPAYPGISLITFNIMQNLVHVTDIKFNGQSLTASPPDVAPLIDPSIFAKVGYTCEGDALHLSPKAVGLPESGFTLTRDNTWLPSTP